LERLEIVEIEKWSSKEAVSKVKVYK